jgi:O-antigen/teichoic acid export membrane protein
VWLLATVSLPLLLSIGLVIPAAARGLPVKLWKVALDRSELQSALPFVSSLAVVAVGTLLFDNTDAFVISAMPELGVAQIAAYDIGTRFQRLVRPFVEAFVLALSPGLVALAARGDVRALQGNVTAHVRHLLLLSLIPTVGLAGVSKPFVAYWVGEQFVARSVPVMWVALASALLWGPGPYAFRLLVAVSRLRFVTVGGILAGLLNLGLSVFFVRVLDLGLVGVAAGTLVSVVLWSDITLGFEICRAVDLKPQTYLREAWLRPALALPVMLLFTFGLAHLWTPASLLETLVQLGVSMSALSLIAFAMGLTADERKRVTGWVTRRVLDLARRIGARR